MSIFEQVDANNAINECIEILEQSPVNLIFIGIDAFCIPFKCFAEKRKVRVMWGT